METSASTGRLSRAASRAQTMPSHWWMWSGCVVLVGVALLFRLSVTSEVFTSRGVRLLQVDAYLHFRRILLTGQQFPGVSGFDPYVNYPEGVVVAWPPLWDWSVALLGRLMALGQFDQAALLTAAAIFPVIAGVATVVAVGALTWMVFGRNAAVPAAFFAAVSPALRTMSQVGNVDHHAGVSLGSVLIVMTTAWLARMPEGRGALSRAGLVTRTLALSAAMTGSLLIWLGSIVPVFVAWLFFLALALIRGRGAVSRLTVAGGSFVVAGLALVPFRTVAEPTFGAVSPLQIAALLGGGLMLVLVAAVMRRHSRLIVLGALVVVAGGLIAGIYAGPVRPLLDAALGGVVKAFGWYPWAQQTQEWQPLLKSGSRFTFVNAEVLYGKLVYLPLFFLVVLIARDLLGARSRRRVTATRGPAELASRAVFHLFALAFLGMALTAQVYHQLFAPAAAVLWGGGLALVVEAVVVPCMRRLRALPRRRLAEVQGVALAVLTVLTLIANNTGTERLGIATPTDLMAAMEWLGAHTPSPGDDADATARPAYGVMSTWAYGDYIAGVARRPVVSDGANEWNLDGLVRSQRFFQTTSDEEASSILTESGLRYVLVGSQFVYLQGDISRAGPPSGWIDPQAPRNFFHNQIPAELKSTMTYNRLYAAAYTDPRNPVKGLSRFKLVYMGSERGIPLFIYEHVRGATLVGRVGAGDEVSAYLHLGNSRGQQYTFVFGTTADQEGRYRLTVPYATGLLADGLGTETSYTLTVGDKQVATVQVVETQVRDGLEVPVG